jgi:beta-lactamase superfamily II metal-dependent hydrolase
MTALDVGQGDALLLEFPEGLPWLIDGGGIPGSRIDIGVRRVLPALRARGVDQLGLVVLTHGDADHAGGLFAVLEQLRVDQLLLPRGRRVGAAERSLISLAEQRGVSVIVSDEGAVLPELAGGVTADLLHPLEGWRFTNESTNDGSVVLRVVLGAVGFLLTGDIEAAAEEHLLRSDLDLRATVLKLAHHGSRTSSSGDFLDRVRPMVALAGIGKENRFGFPHQGTISRLRERDVELYWTGRHGELRVCTDGLALTVDTRPEGRWLRSLEYSAQEVAGWAVRPPDPSLPDSSPSEVEGVAETLDLDTVRTSRRTPRVRGGKGRQRPRGLKDSTRDKEAVPPPAPRLMDDRQWERSRKERGVRRPPWKSRR